MNVIGHDFETTSKDPHTCGVVQLALLKGIVDVNGAFRAEFAAEALINPGFPIPPDSTAIHGKTDADVAAAPAQDSGVIAEMYQAFMEGRREPLLIGYNSAGYDDVIVDRLAPDAAPMWRLDLFVPACRLLNRGVITGAKLVEVYEQLTGEKAINAHDAMADVKMTLALIKPMMAALDIHQFSEFVSWCRTPIADVNMRMPFGKHSGRTLGLLPQSYLDWACKNLTGISADLKASLELARVT